MADDSVTYDDRQAEPGATIKTQTGTGVAVKLKADDKGVVHIANADQQEAADYLQLPVATKATQAAAVADAKAAAAADAQATGGGTKTEA